MSNIRELSAKAVARAHEVMDGGGGEITIRGPSYVTGVIRTHVGAEAHARGFSTTIRISETSDELLIRIRPAAKRVAAPGVRGAPKSPHRVAIEALAPGEWVTFDLEEVGIDNLRAIVQATKRATLRTFVTRQVENGTAVMVTRIDNLELASKDLREAIQRELQAKNKKWPFHDMAAGEDRTVLGGDVETARSMATYHKRKYGKVFSVTKTADGVFIYRDA